jgi:hypothetical protein
MGWIVTKKPAYGLMAEVFASFWLESGNGKSATAIRAGFAGERHEFVVAGAAELERCIDQLKSGGTSCRSVGEVWDK